MEYHAKTKFMLKIPEYGRNIQQMVDHMRTIKDKKTRTAAAFTIIDIMKNIVKPSFKDKNEQVQKLWNDINVMTDYQLDIIDIPYNLPKKNISLEKQERLTYPNTETKHSHYGFIVNKFIQKITQMEEREERKILTILIANYMKRTLVARNKKEVNNQVIFKDLNKLSNEKISLNPQTNLADFKPYHKNIKRHRGKKSHSSKY